MLKMSKRIQVNHNNRNIARCLFGYIDDYGCKIPKKKDINEGKKKHHKNSQLV